MSVWRTSAAASWVFDNWALQPEEALHGRLTAGARTVNGALSSTPWRSQYLLLGPPLGAFRSFATPWVAYVPMAFAAGGGRSFCSVRRLAAAFECTMLIGARRRPARPPRRRWRPASFLRSGLRRRAVLLALVRAVGSRPRSSAPC